MKETHDVTINLPSCRLVEYGDHHVETYHGWMQDPWIQEMTSSEPLTMEEEISMQKEWASDPDKGTFIIEAPRQADAVQEPPEQPGSPSPHFTMVGDVNMFLLDPPDDAPGGAPAPSAPAEGTGGALPTPKQVELMVMVAEADYRRQGLARQALRGIMRFALTDPALGSRVQATSFIAKILQSNAASIALFTSLGFRETAKVEAFQEVHLTWWPHEAATPGGPTNLQALLESCCSPAPSAEADEAPALAAAVGGN